MPGAWRQIWREDLLCSFIEMATSRFVNVSNEDISEFLKGRKQVHGKKNFPRCGM